MTERKLEQSIDEAFNTFWKKWHSMIGAHDVGSPTQIEVWHHAWRAALATQAEGEPLTEADLPAHPDGHVMRWTKSESSAILSWGKALAAQPASEPLTVDQIIAVADATKSADPGRDGYILPVTFARAIEAAHGITAPTVKGETS